jgi:hypothetical protein
MKIGAFSLMAAFLLALPLAASAGPVDPCAGQPDTDSDGNCDLIDNCTLFPNAPPLDCDTDGDGYGNPCDGDFDQSNVVNATDFSALFLPDFILTVDSGIGSDMDCSGVVNATDFSVYFLPQFSQTFPGPSAP